MNQLAILDAQAQTRWRCAPACAERPTRLVEVAGRFVGPWSEVALAEASSALEVIPLEASVAGFTASSQALERLALVCEQMCAHEAHRQRSWHWELTCLDCTTSATLLPGSTPGALGLETARGSRAWERSTHPVQISASAPVPGLTGELVGVASSLERVFGAGSALEGGGVRQRARVPQLWCGVGRGRDEEQVSYTDWVLTDGRCVLVSPEGVVLPYVAGDPVECYLGDDAAGGEDAVVVAGYSLTCVVRVSGASWAAQVRETRVRGESSQLLQQLVAVDVGGLAAGTSAVRAALGGL